MEHTVLLVDDERNILNALTRIFRRDGLNILASESGAAGLELLKNNKVSLVISDYRMQGMDGVEFLIRVKEVSPETIRLMLTGYADLKAVIFAINKGEVYRYITKPWSDDDLRAIVKDALEMYSLHSENRRLTELTRNQNMVLANLNRGLESKVAEQTRKIRGNFFGFVRIFADMMELYDQHVGGHSKRVSKMANALAVKMGIQGADAELIETAALLHNIGLIGLPRDLVDKDESQMNEHELALFRQNPILSQELISSIDTLRQVGVIIRSHMEKYDGKGYPDGLRKGEIHIGSGIIAICKCYDNMRHRQEPGLPIREIIQHVKDRTGSDFDPEVADVFLDFLNTWGDGSFNTGIDGSSLTGAEQNLIVSLSTLRPGMTLAKDMISNRGRLLVSKGTVLTNVLIEKILKFNQIEAIIGGVHIVHVRKVS